jgi:hypothetical protein
MNLPYSDFIFSKNMLNPKSPKFAYFAFPNAFGFKIDSAQVVYNCDATQIYSRKGTAFDAALTDGKAFIQKLFDDLSMR